MAKSRTQRNATGIPGGSNGPDAVPSADNQESGWIWSSFFMRTGSSDALNDDEVDAWLEEGTLFAHIEFLSIVLIIMNSEDRVQWFRAEAEYKRWQEQYEIKQVEIIRASAWFTRMSKIWMDLAESTESAGHAAYARKQGYMYSTMQDYAQKRRRNMLSSFDLDKIDGDIVKGMLQRRERDAEALEACKHEADNEA